MSDRAPAQVIFYRVEPREAEAIVGFLNEYGMTPHYMGEEPTDRVELGTVYGASDVNVTVMLEGSTELEAIAPRSAWKLTQDTVYDIEGEHHTYVPELGAWHGFSNNDGEPVFTRDQIMGAVEHGVPLDDLTGGPWVRAIEALQRGIPLDAFVEVEHDQDAAQVQR